MMIIETVHDYKYLVLETSLRSSSLEFFETGEEALTHFENRGENILTKQKKNQTQLDVVKLNMIFHTINISGT